MIRFTGEYLAGMLAGSGLALFFLGLAVQSDVLAPTDLKAAGLLAAGIALVLGGGGWKLRLQSGT